MKWPRSFLDYCLSFMVLLLAVFFTSFLTVNNVSAVDDISIVIDSSSSLTRGQPVFPDCDSSCFSQYHYFKFEVLSSVLYSISDFRFSLVTPGYSNKNVFLPSFTSSYISLTSDISSILFYSESVPSDFSYRLSLSESLPAGDCPVCEECQVCPAIPENPYDDKFDKIITAIYVCAATILVVYFFYCIYRMIIKSAGSV